MEDKGLCCKAGLETLLACFGCPKLDSANAVFSKLCAVGFMEDDGLCCTAGLACRGCPKLDAPGVVG